MTRTSLVVTSALLAIMMEIQPGQAQEDCRPALEPDVYRLDQNTTTTLAVVDRYLSQDTEKQKTDVFAKYGDAELDFGQSKDAMARIEKLLDINYSKQQKTDIYISTLTDNQVAAYTACLNRAHEDLSYTLSSNYIESEENFLQLNWHPTYAVQGMQKGVFKIINESFDGGAKQFEFDIENNKSEDVRIKRDPFKPTIIQGKIDGKGLRAEIPPRPRFKLVLEKRRSKDELAVKTRESEGEKGREICVTLENEEQGFSMVPGTYKFYYTKRAKRGDVVIASNEKIKESVREDERGACAFISVYFRTDFGTNADVTGYGEISVLHAVPVE